MIKGTKLIFLLIFIISLEYSCTKDHSGNEFQKFVFGKVIGEECINCHIFFELENQQVRIFDSRTSQKIVLSNEMYEIAKVLIDSFPRVLIEEGSGYYGDEGNYFGSLIVISEYKDNDFVWSFDLNAENVRQDIRPYAIKLSQVISEMDN